MLARTLQLMCDRVDTCRQCPQDRLPIRKLLEQRAGVELWARCGECQKIIDVLRLCLGEPYYGPQKATAADRSQGGTGAGRVTVM